MNNFSVVCNIHSDYSDIWEPFFENLSKFNANIIIAVNNKETVEPFLKNDYTVVEYDETLVFAQRMLDILNSVNTPYIIYLQDNFIPIVVDSLKLNECVNWLNDNSYDGLQLHINNGDMNKENLIQICDDTYTYNNSVSSYQYTVHPSIWKTDSIYTMFANHKNSIYRNIELDVANYVNIHFKVFRLANIGTTLKSNGCKLKPFFQYIHLLNFRCFNHYDDFIDLKETYLNMVERFKLDMTKRRMRRWDEPL